MGSLELCQGRAKVIRRNYVCKYMEFLLAGKKDGILNGIPDWLYKNTPELNGETLAFSQNGTFLSFLSFNISSVQKYE